MIDPAQALAYTAALGITAAIPGPGITALVARAAGSGKASAFAMLGGLIVGDPTYLTFATFGLAVVAQHFSGLFVAVRWLSIAYLPFLAWSFWTAGRHDLSAGDASRRGLASAAAQGFMLTLGNPKTIVFYLALMPVVVDLQRVGIATWATVLVPLTAAVLFTVPSAFILAALGVRKALSSSAAQRRLHRGAAVAMAGAAGTMIVRELRAVAFVRQAFRRYG